MGVKSLLFCLLLGGDGDLDKPGPQSYHLPSSGTTAHHGSELAAIAKVLGEIFPKDPSLMFAS